MHDSPPRTINLEQWKAENGLKLEGEAQCLACGEHWVGSTPIGTTWIECPKCGSERGVFRYPIEYMTKHWFCTCGGSLFYITPKGCYCPACGLYQKGYGPPYGPKGF